MLLQQETKLDPDFNMVLNSINGKSRKLLLQCWKIKRNKKAKEKKKKQFSRSKHPKHQHKNGGLKLKKQQQSGKWKIIYNKQEKRVKVNKMKARRCIWFLDSD